MVIKWKWTLLDDVVVSLSNIIIFLISYQVLLGKYRQTSTYLYSRLHFSISFYSQLGFFYTSQLGFPILCYSSFLLE